MRTVFLGTPRAAVPALRALAESAHAPAAVVCQPDRRAGRGRRLSAAPVKEAALELGLPVLQPESVATKAFRAELASFEPELLAVVAYGRILGPKLRAVAPRGAINLHFSLLPRWRGAAPVQRALLAGDERTGVSLFRLVDELDAGPVFVEGAVDVEPGEHAPALERRLAELGAGLFVELLDRLEAGEAPEPREQDESGLTLAPPLRREEGRLDPRRAPDELLRRVRALDPWPGARFELESGPLAVLEASVEAQGADGAAPGTVLAVSGQALVVACGEGGALRLERVKPAGRQAMSGASLVNGRVLAVGDVLPVPAGEA